MRATLPVFGPAWSRRPPWPHFKRHDKETDLPDQPEGRELIIGTYTERLPHVDGQAEGILSCSFDGTTVARRGPCRTRNPSFIVLSADRRHLYAVNETVTFEDRPGGGVSAFSRSPASGELVLLNTKSSGGVEPADIQPRPERPVSLGGELPIAWSLFSPWRTTVAWGP